MNMDELTDKERENVLWYREMRRKQEEKEAREAEEAARVKQRKDQAVEIMSEAIARVLELNFSEFRDLEELEHLFGETLRRSRKYGKEYKERERDRESYRASPSWCRCTRPYSWGK